MTDLVTGQQEQDRDRDCANRTHGFVRQGQALLRRSARQAKIWLGASERSC